MDSSPQWKRCQAREWTSFERDPPCSDGVCVQVQRDPVPQEWIAPLLNGEPFPWLELWESYLNRADADADPFLMRPTLSEDAVQATIDLIEFQENDCEDRIIVTQENLESFQSAGSDYYFNLSIDNDEYLFNEQLTIRNIGTCNSDSSIATGPLVIGGRSRFLNVQSGSEISFLNFSFINSIFIVGSEISIEDSNFDSQFIDLNIENSVLEISQSTPEESPVDLSGATVLIANSTISTNATLIFGEEEAGSDLPKMVTIRNTTLIQRDPTQPLMVVNHGAHVTLEHVLIISDGQAIHVKSGQLDVNGLFTLSASQDMEGFEEAEEPEEDSTDALITLHPRAHLTLNNALWAHQDERWAIEGEAGATATLIHQVTLPIQRWLSFTLSSRSLAEGEEAEPVLTLAGSDIHADAALTLIALDEGLPTPDLTDCNPPRTPQHIPTVRITDSVLSGRSPESPLLTWTGGGQLTANHVELARGTLTFHPAELNPDVDPPIGPTAPLTALSSTQLISTRLATSGVLMLKNSTSLDSSLRGEGPASITLSQVKATQETLNTPSITLADTAQLKLYQTSWVTESLLDQETEAHAWLCETDLHHSSRAIDSPLLRVRSGSLHLDRTALQTDHQALWLGASAESIWSDVEVSPALLESQEEPDSALPTVLLEVLGRFSATDLTMTLSMDHLVGLYGSAQSNITLDRALLTNIDAYGVYLDEQSRILFTETWLQGSEASTALYLNNRAQIDQMNAPGQLHIDGTIVINATASDEGMVDVISPTLECHGAFYLGACPDPLSSTSTPPMSCPHPQATREEP